MHSFQPSRGRIFFEFLCALGIVASSVGAWKQTGASALLLAAFVAGLYGFVRLLDLSRPRAAVPTATPVPRIEPVPMPQPDINSFLEAVGPESTVDHAPEPAVEARLAETAPAKPRRKSGGRKPKTAEVAKVVELVQPEEVTPEPEQAVDPAAQEEAELAEFAVSEESASSHIAPLFEPEPFARMQRRAFGRRGRL
jgi:hypothetical protein